MTLAEIADRLVEGRWYRFVYRRSGGRVWDECVAQYLGVNRERDELTLSLRPLAGTSALRPKQVQHVYAAREQRPSLPRRSATQAGGVR